MTDLSSYHARAESWADDRRRGEARGRRLAWIVAGGAAALALVEGAALAWMAPLKQVAPVMLLVDRQTGFVQAVDPLKPRSIAADTALTQSLLAQYVVAREGYDKATVRVDYARIALQSAGSARAAYLAAMPATNPSSPVNRFANGGTRTVRIKSVSLLSPVFALVRFDTQVLDRTGKAAMPQPWIAVIRFRYVQQAMSLDQRLVNPLGFQVQAYRFDAEAAPVPDAAGDGPPHSSAIADYAPAMAVPVAPVAVHVVPGRRVTYAPVVVPVTPATLIGDPRRSVAPSQVPVGSPLRSAAADANPAPDHEP